MTLIIVLLNGCKKIEGDFCDKASIIIVPETCAVGLGKDIISRNFKEKIIQNNQEYKKTCQ